MVAGSMMLPLVVFLCKFVVSCYVVSLSAYFSKLSMSFDSCSFSCVAFSLSKWSSNYLNLTFPYILLEVTVVVCG